MTTLRTVIADDEHWAVKRLEAQLNSIDGIEIVATARDGAEAARLISEHHPDLVVLDIKMPAASGLEVLRSLPGAKTPHVVFVTAFEEFAPEAFEVDAVDYLLKPIERHRLVRALERVRVRRTARAALERASDLEHVLEAMRRDRRDKPGARYDHELWVRQGERTVRVNIEQIDWFESDRDYAIIHIGERALMMRQSLTQLAKSLDPARFIRVHRSAIVRSSFVKSVERKKGRACAVVLANDVRLPIGTTYSTAVSQLLRRT